MRLAEEADDKFGRALVQQVVAEATSRCEPPDPSGAGPAILEAINIREEIGVRPELSRSYRNYARLLKARRPQAFVFRWRQPPPVVPKILGRRTPDNTSAVRPNFRTRQLPHNVLCTSLIRTRVRPHASPTSPQLAA